MTRVLIDCRLMFYRKAGIAQYTRRLAQALAQLPNVSVVLLLDRRDTDTSWVPAGARVMRSVTPAHHRYESKMLPMEIALRRRTFDVYHAPDFIAPRGSYPKVITIHDLYFMQDTSVMSREGASYYGGTHRSARRADHIIAVSAFTRDDILRLMPDVAPSKVSVVHEAADAIPQDMTPRDAGDYALFVGTFEPRKNLPTLLRALAQTPTDIKMLIVGARGWDSGAAEQLADELQLRERVRFIAGHLQADELNDIYRNARMLLLPSLYEGFGLPALEAMQRGVPVICSNAGSLPEIVGDAALLHDPLDAAMLARHIERVWRDTDLRADLTTRGIARAAQFSWQRAAVETLAVYQKAIARKQK